MNDLLPSGGKMKKKSLKLTLYLLMSVLISCQNIQPDQKTDLETSLSSDDGRLDLSLSTLEQQNVEKEKAKQSLLNARQKRTIVKPVDIEELKQESSVNVVLFARQTSNNVGEKLYNRITTKRKNSTRCLRFVSADDAQRFFLEKDGPEKDHWDLDPDGDGFACKWDPKPYRILITNRNN